MIKKNYLSFFIAVIIAGTTHVNLTASEEQEKTKSNSFIVKVSVQQSEKNKKLPILGTIPILGLPFKDKSIKEEKLTKEELKIRASKAVSRMFFYSPCGAGARANAVQKETSNQSSPAVNQAPTQGQPFYAWPDGSIEYYT